MSVGGREIEFFRQAESFAVASAKAKNEKDLFGLLEAACHDIGFRFFALLHHVDFRSGEAISLHNYPAGWVEYFITNDLFSSDPIHRASNTTNLGFAWARLPDMIKLTSADREILRLAKSAGITDGFTIPAHIPGEVNGSCSFATSSGRELQQDQIPIAQLIGSFAFEAARRLTYRGTGKPVERCSPLTQRQRDCVVLVAQGKSDWEISRILGISQETVIEHLKQARQRYGVTKRTMLAVRALYDGSVSFDEALGRRRPTPHFLV